MCSFIWTILYGSYNMVIIRDRWTCSSDQILWDFRLGFRLGHSHGLDHEFRQEVRHNSDPRTRVRTTLITDDFFGYNFRIDHECQQLIQLAILWTVFTRTYSQSSLAHLCTKLYLISYDTIKQRELIWIDSFWKILGIASNWKTDKSSVNWIGNACKMSNRIKYNFGFLFKEKCQICYKIHSGYKSLDSNWIFIPYFYFWKRKQELFKIMRMFAENLDLLKMENMSQV